MHGRVGLAWGIRIVAFITLACFVLGTTMMSMPERSFMPSGKSLTRRSTWKEVIIGTKGDWPYLLVLIQGFIMSLGTFVPPFYIQLFSELHGINKETSFYALSIMNVTGMLGRIIPNYLADRFGVLNVYIPCLATAG